jgi:hypothetical protein
VATWNDVRRIAAEFPGTSETRSSGGYAQWVVNKKLFVWERPLRPSDLAALGDAAPKGAVLGVRTPDLELKDVLIASNPRVYFTTPHFDGYAAVLLRLARIGVVELRDVMREAWLVRAPKRVAAGYLAGRGPRG